MVRNNLSFNYTSASLLAIFGSLITVAVTFGLHMTEENIHSTLQLAGLVLGAIAAGGGAKSAALLRAKVAVPEWLHLTPATIVSAAGAVLSLAAGYGLHMTQDNINSLLELVGLVSAGLVVGGGVKSAGMIASGTHPALARATYRGDVRA